MTEIVIHCKYDEEWKQKDDGSYEWCSKNNERKSIVLSDNLDKVKFCDIIDNLFERLSMNRMSTVLKISYISQSFTMSERMFILDVYDVKGCLLDHCAISKRRSVFYVELIKKNESGEGNEKVGLEIEEVEGNEVNMSHAY